jgi:hypothetical protein
MGSGRWVFLSCREVPAGIFLPEAILVGNKPVLRLVSNNLFQVRGAAFTPVLEFQVA